MPPEFPARIGPYDVVGIIGSGRLGTVYRAFDEAQTRGVAIRVLSPDLLADAPRLERFRRGARVSAAIVHENVLRTLDEGQDGGLVYAVTEYVDGCALSDRLQSSLLTLAEAIHVLHDVADGLGAAHRAGLVHGDLNPHNVLVSRDLSVVKVGDFGTADSTLAGAAARTAALARARIGSVLYRAPELAGDRGEATVCSDVYSLGVIAYEAMTGKLPIGKFSLPSDVNNQVPLELDPIVLKCLATDPAQRYQSVTAFVADLDKVEEVVDYRLMNELKRLSGGRLFARKETPRPGRSRPASILPYLGPAAIVFVGVAVIAALLLRGRGDNRYRADAPSAPTAAAARAATAPSAAPPVSTAPPVPAPGGAPASAPADTPLVSTTLPQSMESLAPAAAPVSVPASVPPAAAVQSPASANAAPQPSSTSESAAGRAGAPAARSAAAVKPAAAVPRKPVPLQAPAAPDADGAAGVLFTEAQALIKANQDVEARTKLASIGEHYSQSRWFVPAMMVKIDIENRRALQEFDAVVGRVAAASVQTKRLLAERAPLHPTAEAALWQLGESYDDMKRYDLAVHAYVQLATRFPNTRLDAWFRAGEISERRLKNREEARASYLKVPPASARYEDAQNRARKLAGR